MGVHHPLRGSNLSRLWFCWRPPPGPADGKGAILREPPEIFLRFLTLRHPWGTAAMAASEKGLYAITLRGGQRELARILSAGAPSKLAPACGGDPLLAEVRDWLDAILGGGGFRPLSVPLDSAPGTPFQEKVWQALAKIPPGESLTYAGIARRIGRPRAARAVGAASAANPIPPLIPCHRLIGSDGGLRGYAGGIGMKMRLIEAERKPS